MLLNSSTAGNKNKTRILYLTAIYTKYSAMKKIYLFILLGCLLGLLPKAQTITPELINMTRLVKYEAEHPGLNHHCSTCPKGEVDGGWKMMIPDLPIPSGANIKKQLQDNLRPATPAIPLSPLTASPPPNQNFLGHLDPVFTIPPDSHGAVGPNHVVTATNDFIRVHLKNGTVISNIDFATFTGFSGGSSDPYIVYDPVAERWYMSAIDVSVTNANRVMLAVSQTNDPTGNWFKYNFVPNLPGGSFLFDHPYLGFDNRWIVISGRKFPNGTSFTGPVLFVFDKANALANGSITFGSTNAQAIEKTPNDGDAPLPVSLYGTNPNPNTFYILQSWSGTQAAIRLSTVTGNLPTATWNTTTAVFPTGGTPWNYSPGNIAEQLSETRKLATNDSRISSGVMVNGNIWCTHHIGISASNVAVQWWQLNGTAAGGSFGNVLQRGRIGDGQANTYRWFPSIAVNGNEDVIIGYTVSSNLLRVSAAYSFRNNITPPNTTDDEYIYKAGISTYFKNYGGTRARWGDYSHSALDPTDGSLWTIQEYAAQRTGAADNDSRYGVWWAQVTPSSTLLQRDASIGVVIEPAAGLVCKVPVTPSFTIRNLGVDTLRSVQAGMILDNVAIGTLTTINNLAVPSFNNSAVVSLNQSFIVTPGNHTLKIYTINPNGDTDLRPSNDTTAINFTVVRELILPYTENFTSSVFPPANGSAIINDDGPAGITWARTTLAGKPGPASMRINCFNYGPDQSTGNVGQRDIYRTPKINTGILDSLSITFNVAYQQYFGTDVATPPIDSLNIVYSPDCGITWYNTAYAKGGATLSTVAGTTTANFRPANASQWRTERVVLKNFCTTNLDNMMIGFESINDFGNNIYVDSINIVGFRSSALNAILKSISKPLPALCSTTSFTPAITFGNAGFDTIRTLQLKYLLDAGQDTTTLNWTGSLAKCDSVNITLAPGTASVGTHVLTIFTSQPNGNPDEITSNDTLRIIFSVYAATATPVFEGFEANNFPRDNWGVQNVNGGTTFERSTATAKTGVGSMLINNADSRNSNGAVDYFISPIVMNSASFDSVFVDFDMSYKSGPQYPGSTVFPLDTLEILATSDCGATFTSVWKKWGDELQTVNDPNYTYSTPFTPSIKNEWKSRRQYLTPFVGAANFQLYFAVKGNKQNSLWIDNINITSQTLPQRLKNQGYLIYPNPFNSSFLIHHSAVEPPVDLRSAQVFNSSGQLVWEREYHGNAERQITVDLNNMASGIFILKMIYTNKTVVERIVKH